jgi:glycosyltransferase involved in cell wall biosynthesis
VIVVAYRSEATIGPVLRALRTQRLAPYEVLVVESSGDGTAELLRTEFPEVRLLAWPERLYPGAARNRGLPGLSGDAVACLDADCVPEADWTERIAKGMAEGRPALAGATLNAPDSSVVGWAYFLSEFAPWLPDRHRFLVDAPTCNTAYRAGLIESVGGFTGRRILSADSLFHWQLNERTRFGLWFDPAMRVRHSYLGSARDMLCRRFAHGRSLSAARQVHRSRSAWYRAGAALGAALLLPPFYVLRLFRRAFGHPDVPRGAFLRALPLTTLALLLWAWGQAVGWLEPPPAEA